jgi:hypothetical protein
VLIRTESDIAQPLPVVWRFAADPMKQLLWDRSVAEVRLTSPGPVGVGSTFDTVGPGRRGLVTSYRVAEFEPPHHARVEVTDSRTLRRASWDFRFTPSATGTRVRWEIDLTPRPAYALLGVLLRANRHQLVRDMRWFEEALEAECAAGPRSDPA